MRAEAGVLKTSQSDTCRTDHYLKDSYMSLVISLDDLVVNKKKVLARIPEIYFTAFRISWLFSANVNDNFWSDGTV
jgi:hypothetical protein